jgi:outer membrane lipoprotein carrier protein
MTKSLRITRLPIVLLLGFVMPGFVGPVSVASAEAPAGSFACERPLTDSEQSGILERVEDRYRAFENLSAEFVQSSYFIGLGDTVKSSGRVRFKKPGMMDWIYAAPDKQRFVADGETLWFYQPAQNQVTLGEFKDSFSSELPVSFLLGIGQLGKNFSLLKACRSAAGDVLQLKSESDSNLQEFYLLVDEKTKLPEGAKIVDVGGNETEIVFAQISLEQTHEPESFHFPIPRGTDIIDQRSEERKRSRTNL